MNHRRSGKKAWMKPGTTMTQKQWVTNPEAYPDAIKKQIDFYNFLLQENSGYKLFYEDDNLIIFSRKE